MISGRRSGPVSDGCRGRSSWAKIGKSGPNGTHHGAHDIYGAIRDKWASLGWEQSSLGFPTSGEYAIPGGRRNDFQGGSITWTAAAGAVVLPGGPAGPPGAIVLTGSGNGVVGVSKPSGPMLVESRKIVPTPTNFTVQAFAASHWNGTVAYVNGPIDDVVAPLDFEGTFDLSPVVQTSSFGVEADTSWSITLLPLTAIGTFTKGQTVSESRSTVWHYTGPAGLLHVTNTDAKSPFSFFVVQGYNADTSASGTPISVSGDYDGVVPVKADQYLWIRSDGTWSMSVS